MSLIVTLEYKEKTYKVIENDSNPDDGSSFSWEEGNYSCDCNRSGFIQYIDPDFPDLECGETIKLIKMEYY